jgi:methyltransferase (TIGR00027 family)
MAKGPRGNISQTATNMALIRALETVKPKRHRLFGDPYAGRFLPGWQRAVMIPARLPTWRRMIECTFDRQAPGARTSGTARTRLIDEWTREAAWSGATQVVIMGAGFDCRALRIAELEAVVIFELDRCEMLNLKSDLLDDTAVRDIRRVPIDFLNEKPEDCLIAAGYSPTAKTLFIWEGVTNYLDVAAVDAAFDFFRRSAPGSRVIFTYVHADALDGSFPAPGLVQLLDRLRRLGEAWTFGFRPQDVPDYLAQRGFRLIADLGAAEYRALYWPRPRQTEGYEFYRIVLAEKRDAARQA